MRAVNVATHEPVELEGAHLLVQNCVVCIAESLLLVQVQNAVSLAIDEVISLRLL